MADDRSIHEIMAALTAALERANELAEERAAKAFARERLARYDTERPTYTPPAGECGHLAVFGFCALPEGHEGLHGADHFKDECGATFTDDEGFPTRICSLPAGHDEDHFESFEVELAHPAPSEPIDSPARRKAAEFDHSCGPDCTVAGCVAERRSMDDPHAPWAYRPDTSDELAELRRENARLREVLAGIFAECAPHIF